MSGGTDSPPFEYGSVQGGGGGGGIVYPSGPTDPPFPPGVGSALYYNTILLEWLGYDPTRDKWLSLASHEVDAGWNGSLLVSAFLAADGGMGMGVPNEGVSVQEGTIVHVELIQDGVNASDLEVLVNGVVVYTLAITGVGRSFDVLADVDIDAGIMALRNKSTGATLSEVQAKVTYKRRV